MSSRVRSQYEALPYPPRSPDYDRENPPGVSPPHDLRMIEYLACRGMRDLRRDWRILVAGGGTGDSVVSIASQLEREGRRGEVVYLDLSSASMAIARQRVEALGIGNVRFVQGSLLNVGAMGLGEFDFIECCGVLHHLPDPQVGANALASVLSNGGAMSVMLYGESARLGVYLAQRLLKAAGLHDPDSPHADRVAWANRILDSVPETNAFMNAGSLGWHAGLAPEEVYDRFLHEQDTPFSVASSHSLMNAAGMRIVDFVPACLYLPQFWIRDPEILQRVQSLPLIQQYEFVEYYTGIVAKLNFVAVKECQRASTVADLNDPKLVPEMLAGDGRDVAEYAAAHHRIRADIGAVTVNVPARLSRLDYEILSRIDGRRNLETMYREISEQAPVELSYSTFHSSFSGLFRMLNCLGYATAHIPV